LKFYDNFKEDLILYSDGDARVLLNTFERVVEFVLNEKRDFITNDDFLNSLSDFKLNYDKKYEEHYNILSAFHKSLRGSDPDASLYWGFRMLEAGESPRNIFRRLIACASEDIGNADPNALVIAVSAWKAFEFLGRPEGDLPLAQAIIYIATAPKSNASYRAMKSIKEIIKKEGNLEVPNHLKNSITHLMKKFGYGKGYKYPHDFPFAFVKQDYLPEKIKEKKFYKPNDIGFEREILKRLEWWNKLKQRED
jgi:putative ATPase